MIAFLLVEPAHHAWALPAWLTPDSEKLGLMLVRLALSLLFALLARQVLFLLIRRMEKWGG